MPGVEMALRSRRPESEPPCKVLERNRLRRLLSWGSPGFELIDTLLPARCSMVPENSAIEELVTVVAPEGDIGIGGSGGNGGSGNGAFERRFVLFEEPFGLNRPAVAWLFVLGLESFWEYLR